MLKLSQDKIYATNPILQEFIPEYEVRVLGSRASGHPKPYSDLDLSIKSEKPLSLDRLARLKMAFEESDLPFRVDIVDWTRTEESFKRKIMEGSIPFPDKP